MTATAIPATPMPKITSTRSIIDGNFHSLRDFFFVKFAESSRLHPMPPVSSPTATFAVLPVEKFGCRDQEIP
jgi:hypothetical protein